MKRCQFGFESNYIENQKFSKISKKLNKTQHLLVKQIFRISKEKYNLMTERSF